MRAGGGAAGAGAGPALHLLVPAAARRQQGEGALLATVRRRPCFMCFHQHVCVCVCPSSSRPSRQQGEGARPCFREQGFMCFHRVIVNLFISIIIVIITIITAIK